MAESSASRLRIIPSEPEHVSQLADVMRDDDRAEALCFGMLPKAALWQSFRGSVMCKTAYVDGDIAAMYGLGGNLLSDIGHPFLVTSRAIERLPLAFVRQAQRELAAMLDVKPLLVNYVDARYRRSIRFLQVLGFSIGAVEPFPGTDALVQRFEMARG